jgi:DNA-binding MarR family transcriptional regulator
VTFPRRTHIQVTGCAFQVKLLHKSRALQRLEDKKWLSAKWGVSEHNRKARFYSLTAKGRQQLIEKTSEWQRLTRAMGLILDGRPSSEEV